MITLGKVCAVLFGGVISPAQCSVLWEDIISILERGQYCGGKSQVL